MILFDDPNETDANGRTVDEALPPARIKVFGVGGGGGNAVNRMIDARLRGIEFITANTDLQALRKNRAPVKMQLGPALTRGLGAGGDPEIGRKAARAGTARNLQLREGAATVRLSAGLGGGAGTRALPRIGRRPAGLGARPAAGARTPCSL